MAARGGAAAAEAAELDAGSAAKGPAAALCRRTATAAYPVDARAATIAEGGGPVSVASRTGAESSAAVTPGEAGPAAASSAAAAAKGTTAAAATGATAGAATAAATLTATTTAASSERRFLTAALAGHGRGAAVQAQNELLVPGAPLPAAAAAPPRRRRSSPILSKPKVSLRRINMLLLGSRTAASAVLSCREEATVAAPSGRTVSPVTLSPAAATAEAGDFCETVAGVLSSSAAAGPVRLSFVSAAAAAASPSVRRSTPAASAAAQTPPAASHTPHLVAASPAATAGALLAAVAGASGSTPLVVAAARARAVAPCKRILHSVPFPRLSAAPSLHATATAAGAAHAATARAAAAACAAAPVRDTPGAAAAAAAACARAVALRISLSSATPSGILRAAAVPAPAAAAERYYPAVLRKKVSTEGTAAADESRRLRIRGKKACGWEGVKTAFWRNKENLARGRSGRPFSLQLRCTYTRPAETAALRDVYIASFASLSASPRSTSSSSSRKWDDFGRRCCRDTAAAAAGGSWAAAAASAAVRVCGAAASAAAFDSPRLPARAAAPRLETASFVPYLLFSSFPSSSASSSASCCSASFAAPSSSSSSSSASVSSPSCSPFSLGSLPLTRSASFLVASALFGFSHFSRGFSSDAHNAPSSSFAASPTSSSPSAAATSSSFSPAGSCKSGDSSMSSSLPHTYPQYSADRFRKYLPRQLQQLAANLAARGCADLLLWTCLINRAIEINNVGGGLPSTSSQTPTAAAAHPADDSSGAAAAGFRLGGAPAVERLTGDSRAFPVHAQQQGFRPFEAIRFLASAAAVGFADRELYLSFVPTFLRHASLLEVRQLVQLLTLYEAAAAASAPAPSPSSSCGAAAAAAAATSFGGGSPAAAAGRGAGLRPRRLYVAIFNAFLRLSSSRSLYSHEYADILCCLARLRIANAAFLQSFGRNLAAAAALLTFSDLARCVGALRALGVAADPLFATLDEKQHAEVLLLPPQQLLDEYQKVLQLEFGWEPYETLIREEFKRRTEAMREAEDVEQLADPFGCLNFMKLQDLVTDNFLRALCKWCKDAVHRPATRSQKRPLAHQLVLLYDTMRERYMENEKALEQAIVRFAADAGGRKRREREVTPLLYQRNRRYIACPDFLPEGVEPAPPSHELKNTLHTDVHMRSQHLLVRPGTAADVARAKETTLRDQAEAAYRRLQKSRKFLRYVHEQAAQQQHTRLPSTEGHPA